MVRLWLEQLPKRPSSARRVLNKKDSEGFTAMHYAARFNRLKIMQMLVDSGAGQYSLPLRTYVRMYMYIYNNTVGCSSTYFYL